MNYWLSNLSSFSQYNTTFWPLWSSKFDLLRDGANNCYALLSCVGLISFSQVNLYANWKRTTTICRQFKDLNLLLNNLALKLEIEKLEIIEPWPRYTSCHVTNIVERQLLSTYFCQRYVGCFLEKKTNWPELNGQIDPNHKNNYFYMKTIVDFICKVNFSGHSYSTS